MLSRDIHENGHNKDYNSSGFEAILYRMYNTRKVLLTKFEGFRIIVLMIKGLGSLNIHKLYLPPPIDINDSINYYTNYVFKKQ